ncbi:MAG: hypothetical protein HZC23_15815 [Rhodocyclales bacterium]|nr:hypothetical protein [Rhodocyclales bacterium]
MTIQTVEQLVDDVQTGKQACSWRQLLILGSNTLGPECLTSHGFDWIVAPLRVDELAARLTQCKAAEDGWGKRIRCWQDEGAMGDEPTVIIPGVIGWLVDVDVTCSSDGTLKILLGEMADRLVAYPPHLILLFQPQGFDAHALASECMDVLRLAVPFRFRNRNDAAVAKEDADSRPCHLG